MITHIAYCRREQVNLRPFLQPNISVFLKPLYNTGKHGLFCFLQTNPASLPFSFHTQSFQSDSTSFDMRYEMRAGASGVNGDKGRKGERRSESDGREGEVGKLTG